MAYAPICLDTASTFTPRGGKQQGSRSMLEVMNIRKHPRDPKL